MKFARFTHQDQIFLGVLREKNIEVVEGSFFEAYRPTGTHYPIKDVRLLPPVTPTKIICIAHNYRGLIQEIGEEFPAEPVFFLKPPSSLIGAKDPIVFPEGAKRVIFEGELALVIKDRMKDVPQNEALNHVLGYTCFNDVTERAMIERNQIDLTPAKGFDTFGPIGPCVVTDLNPNTLDLRTYLNGKLMQEDSTANCIFRVEYILHYLSRIMTLYPGDIISTGTPQGIAAMQPGDVVVVEIEGIGRLKNPVLTPSQIQDALTDR
jgi:2-keto-4-pentenoate hydratase/2-oxohepta-3-ene-1,7-dioic acid hydratase in catechol pathway